MSQVFNALNGPELIKVILADVEKRLNHTGEFEGNVTFPWVKYSFKVDLVVYPKQSVDAEPGIVAKGEGQMGAEQPGYPLETPKLVAVEGSEIVDTPDVARISAGIALPTTTVGAGGVMVDKPIMAPEPAPPVQRKGTFVKKGEIIHGTGSTSPAAPSGNGDTSGVSGNLADTRA